MNLYIEAVGFGIIAAASIAIGAMGFTLQFGLTNVLNIGYGAIMSARRLRRLRVLHGRHVDLARAWSSAAWPRAPSRCSSQRRFLAVYARRGAGCSRWQ